MDKAKALARTLVQERLAACINIVPHLHSIYLWKGKVEDSEEVLLVIKCTKARLSALQTRLHELHPYDVPEFVALMPEQVSPGYESWLIEALQE